jgi:hypothetical protein
MGVDELPAPVQLDQSLDVWKDEEVDDGNRTADEDEPKDELDDLHSHVDGRDCQHREDKDRQKRSHNHDGFKSLSLRILPCLKFHWADRIVKSRGAGGRCEYRFRDPVNA